MTNRKSHLALVATGDKIADTDREAGPNQAAQIAQAAKDTGLTPEQVILAINIALLAGTDLSEDGDRVPVATRALTIKCAKSWKGLIANMPERDTDIEFRLHAGAFFAGAVAAAQDFRNALTLGGLMAALGADAPLDPSEIN